MYAQHYWIFGLCFPTQMLNIWCNYSNMIGKPMSGTLYIHILHGLWIEWQAFARIIDCIASLVLSLQSILNHYVLKAQTKITDKSSIGIVCVFFPLSRSLFNFNKIIQPNVRFVNMRFSHAAHTHIHCNSKEFQVWNGVNEFDDINILRGSWDFRFQGCVKITHSDWNVCWRSVGCCRRDGRLWWIWWWWWWWWYDTSITTMYRHNSQGCYRLFVVTKFFTHSHL